MLAAAPLAAVLLGNGVVLFAAGVLSAAWPQALAGAGFAADPSPLRRIVGLLFFGGTGAIALFLGYGLLKAWPSAWRRFTDIATAVVLVAGGFIWESSGQAWLAWAALIAAGSSLALYFVLRPGLPENLPAG